MHIPCDGKLLKTSYIPGKLYSVNPKTAESIPELFSQNERLVCYVQGPEFPFVLIFVGATLVAGIHTVWHGRYTPRLSLEEDFSSRDISFQKGDEIGHFQFGSTVILIVPKGKEWKSCFQENECLQFGDRLISY